MRAHPVCASCADSLPHFLQEKGEKMVAFGSIVCFASQASYSSWHYVPSSTTHRTQIARGLLEHTFSWFYSHLLERPIPSQRFLCSYRAGDSSRGQSALKKKFLSKTFILAGIVLIRQNWQLQKFIDESKLNKFWSQEGKHRKNLWEKYFLFLFVLFSINKRKSFFRLQDL